MRGLDPRIHVVQRARCTTWMPATSAGMTGSYGYYTVFPGSE